MKIARRRLTRKLVLLHVLPVIAGFALFGAVTLGVWRAALVADADLRLADHTATLRAALSLAAPERRADLAALVDRVAATETAHGLAIYDEAGRALARSAPLDADPARVDALAQATLATGAIHHAMERLGAREALVRAERVEGGGAARVVVMAMDARPIEVMLRRAEARIVVAGAALCLVASLIGLWLSRSLAGGLGQLVDAAEHLAAGDRQVPRVEASRWLELDRVAGAMNDLAAGLAAARSRAEAAEDARGALEQRIIHAQALAVLGQVAGSVAHEIGSPLGTILGWARLASTDEDLPAPARAQFEMIAAQSARITRIVERLLSLARPPRERREPVSVGEVAREVTTFLGPELRAHKLDLDLDLDLDPASAEPAPRVRAVRDQLAQVLLNLCLNAVQVQPAGGRLRVSVRAEQREGERVVVTQVADAGPGVPESLRAQVFEPFYSTKVDRGGTGLGLAVVADIVRDLGGRVTIGDAPEGGALFEVVLPIGG